ncbi:MAG: tetratricopeptide repeat protein, partial [Microcystaceae cyanobacterium]
RFRGRSLILAVLLFLLAMGAPLAITQVSVSSPKETIQLIEQGRERYQARQFEEAAKAWQQAAETFAAQGDSLNQAMALSNLSLTYQHLGKWDEAHQAINESLNLLKSQQKTPEQLQILASTVDIQGQLQLAVGQSEAALETWQQAADIYANLGNQDGEMRSHINQAQAMQELGLYPRACETLLDVLKLNHQDCSISQKDFQLLKERQASPLQILGLRSLGNVLRVVGQTEQSQMVLLASWQFAQQLGDSQNLAAIYLSLGNIARALGNQKVQQEEQSLEPVALTHPIDCIQGATNGTAMAFYQQAATCYRQAESSASPITSIQAQLNLLSLLVQTQQ